MTIPLPERHSALVQTNFLIPDADESTKAVVRLTRNGYSHDYELTYEQHDNNVLSTSEDVPADLGKISLLYFENNCRMESTSPAESDAVFEVQSFEHNGKVIYTAPPPPKVWPEMVIPAGSIESSKVSLEGFTLPDFAEGAVLRTILTYEGIETEVKFTYMSDDFRLYSEDVISPNLGLFYLDQDFSLPRTSVMYEDTAQADIKFKVISFEQDGETIYP